MSQQDIPLPRRWEALGSFTVDSPHTVQLICTSRSDAAGQLFTVGPPLDLGYFAGLAARGVATPICLLVGVVRRIRPQ